jgi:boron transporter
VTRQRTDVNEEHKGKVETVVDYVVEQRVSNLAQGLLILGTMSGPLLAVLHLIPEAVLSGLFFVMGIQALEANGITKKILFLASDRSHTPASDPLKCIQRRTAVWLFLGIELLGFGATFAITQTIAAVGFPVFILLLIPVRSFLLPKYFTESELLILDAPTASPFTMESVGGSYGVPDVLFSVATPPLGEFNKTNGGSSKETVGRQAQGDIDEDSMERGEDPIRKRRRSSILRDERVAAFRQNIDKKDVIELRGIK